MKRRLSLLLVLVLIVAAFSACGTPTETTTTPPPTDSPAITTDTPETATPPVSEEPKEEVTITMPTYRSGEDVGAVYFLPAVERFNEKFKGQYKVVIEESPSSTHNDKIKGLAQTGKLPPIFQFSDFTYARDVFFNDQYLFNLAPWLDANPEVKNVFVPAGMDYVKTSSGAMYAVPLAILRPTGLYVNNNVYSPEKPVRDMSWDELGASLKAANNTYGFMTLEGAWTLNLTTVAIMASQDGGMQILQDGLNTKVTDFNKPQWVNTFTILKKLYDDAGWKDGIGKAYPPAQNAFLNNQVGVLPDGQWITGVFTDDAANERKADWGEGFDGNKVTGDYYPGNVAVANPCVYDWYVSAQCTEQEREAALAFLAFISSPAELEAMMLAEGGSAPMIQYSQSFLDEMAKDRLKSEFLNNVNKDTKYVPFFHEIVPNSITDSASGAFSANLPQLLDGTQTPEQFCASLTAAANE